MASNTTVIDNNNPIELKVESKGEWQNLALDTLARLTKQFALHPDCFKLIDLVLLSLTGQLSSTGSFACFLTSLEDEHKTMFRGFGLLHKEEQLKELLELMENQLFFISKSEPITLKTLENETNVPGSIIKHLQSAKVVAVVPMKIGDDLLGILGLANKVGNQEYDDNDLRLLKVLSDTISPLLSNSLLYASIKSITQWQKDVIDSVKQGVIIFSHEFKYIQANAQAKLIFGSLNQYVDWTNTNQNISQIFLDRVFPGWSEFIKSSARKENHGGNENLVFRGIDGDRIFLMRVSKTSGQENKQPDIVVTLDETTEQHDSEQKMFEMEKFAEKGVMAASISHELNNHLALILGGVELAELASKRNDFDKVSNSLEKLKKHTLTMERFTAGLTDYSKLDSKKEEVDLNKIIKDVVSFARVQKRYKGISITTALDANLIKIMIDPDQIAQLLMNLMNNAADAIKDCGENDGQIEVISNHVDDKISFTVKDNGIGMPEEIKSKLFNSRFTTKDYGHGFGMMTCGRIIEYHNASPKIQSAPNQGTSITIEFVVK